MYISIASVVSQAQQYMTDNNKTLVNQANNDNHYINKQHYLDVLKKFLSDNEYTTSDFELDSIDKIADFIYKESVEEGIITDLLNDDEVEEVNINAFDDVHVRRAGKAPKTIAEKFLSGSSAIAIIKRMLNKNTATNWDDSRPIIRSFIEKGGTKLRITALQGIIVDNADKLVVSIRKINPKHLTGDDFLKNGTVNRGILTFAQGMVECGISGVVGGGTGSGKTTWLEYMLSFVNPRSLIITIEEDVREFSLRKKVNYQGEELKTNVIYLRTKKSDVPAKAINQTNLLETSLTLDPDYIVVGEMKGAEAWAAQEAGHTGHVVYGTIHIDEASDAPSRMLTLMKGNNTFDNTFITRLATEAFPIVFFFQQCEDGVRRCMEIVEFVNFAEPGKKITEPDIRPVTLFKFQEDTSKRITNMWGKTKHIEGDYIRVNEISDSLLKRLKDKAVSDLAIDKIRMNKLYEYNDDGTIKMERVGDDNYKPVLASH